MVKHKKIYVRSILASCGMMFRVALTVSLPGVMFRSAPLFTRLELPSPTPSPALPWLLTLHFPKLPIYPDELLHVITITQLCPFNLLSPLLFLHTSSTLPASRLPCLILSWKINRDPKYQHFPLSLPLSIPTHSDILGTACLSFI